MRSLSGLLILIIASISLWLAIPRVIASALRAPAYGSVLATSEGMPLRDDQVERAVQFLVAASQWENSRRARTDFADLLIIQARDMRREKPQRLDMARKASLAYRDALGQAPVDPQTWVDLAQAKSIATGPSQEIASLLAQSLTVGPQVARITVSRAMLLLNNWEHLTPGIKEQTQAQVRFAWTYDWAGLTRLVREESSAEVIRGAIRSIPGAVEQFDSAYARQNQ